jgi:hypothetical protein
MNGNFNFMVFYAVVSLLVWFFCADYEFIAFMICLLSVGHFFGWMLDELGYE